MKVEFESARNTRGIENATLKRSHLPPDMRFSKKRLFVVAYSVGALIAVLAVVRLGDQIREASSINSNNSGNSNSELGGFTAIISGVVLRAPLLAIADDSQPGWVQALVR